MAVPVRESIQAFVKGILFLFLHHLSHGVMFYPMIDSLKVARIGFMAMALSHFTKMAPEPVDELYSISKNTLLPLSGKKAANLQ